MMVEGNIELKITGNAPAFFVKKKQEGDFIGVDYKDMQFMICSMFGVEEMGFEEMENKTLYLYGGRPFLLEKTEYGKSIIIGDIPSRIFNNLPEYNLKLFRKND